jgi:hypothetical protein
VRARPAPPHAAEAWSRSGARSVAGECDAFATAMAGGLGRRTRRARVYDKRASRRPLRSGSRGADLGGNVPYRMTWESNFGLYVRFSGRIPPLDFALLNREVTRDARFGTARYAIGDFLAVEGHEFDLDDPDSLLQPNLTLVGAALSVNPRLRVVLVTIDPGIRALMEREIALGAYPYRAEFVATLAAARARLADVDTAALWLSAAR